MLRRNVVDAATAGQFHIYAVTNIDQAITLLTGLPAGEAGTGGEYPEGSINYHVATRLIVLGKISQSLMQQSGKS